MANISKENEPQVSEAFAQQLRNEAFATICERRPMDRWNELYTRATNIISQYGTITETNSQSTRTETPYSLSIGSEEGTYINFRLIKTQHHGALGSIVVESKHARFGSNEPPLLCTLCCFDPNGKLDTTQAVSPLEMESLETVFQLIEHKCQSMRVSHEETPPFKHRN